MRSGGVRYASPKLPTATSFIRKTLSYLTRLIKYIAVNISIIADNNSKPGVDVEVGIGEGV